MNDLMTADRREHPAEAAAVAEVPAGSMTRGAAAGPGRGGRVISLVRLHLLSLRGPLPSLLGLLLIMGAVSIVSGSIVPVSGFLTGTALAGGLTGVIAERSGINRLLASLPVSRAEVIDSYWAVAALSVLAASARSADDLSAAALIRGLGGGGRPTVVDRLRFGSADAVLLALSAAMVALALLPVPGVWR